MFLIDFILSKNKYLFLAFKKFLLFYQTFTFLYTYLFYPKKQIFLLTKLFTNFQYFASLLIYFLYMTFAYSITLSIFSQIAS